MCVCSQVDPGNTGRVGPTEAALFLKKSGLPDITLGKVGRGQGVVTVLSVIHHTEVERCVCCVCDCCLWIFLVSFASLYIVYCLLSALFKIAPRSNLYPVQCSGQ